MGDFKITKNYKIKRGIINKLNNKGPPAAWFPSFILDFTYIFIPSYGELERVSKRLIFQR